MIMHTANWKSLNCYIQFLKNNIFFISTYVNFDLFIFLKKSTDKFKKNFIKQNINLFKNNNFIIILKIFFKKYYYDE